MSITWLKLHHDIVHNVKLRKFTPQEKWAWVTLLVLASENSDRGSVSADDEDLADICEFNSTQDWLYFKDKLRAKGMIEQGSNGLKIANWGKRQHTSPSNNPEATKERKRRQRAKSKSDETLPQPQCHEHVTSMSRACHETDKTKTKSKDTDTDQTTVDLDLVLPPYSYDAQEEELKMGETLEIFPSLGDGRRDSLVNGFTPINSTVLSHQPLHSPSPKVPPHPPSPVFCFDRNFNNPNSRSWFEWQTGPGPNDYMPEFVDYLVKKWSLGKADVKRFFQKNRSNPEAIAVYFDEFKSSQTSVNDLVMNVLRKKVEEQNGYAANW